MSYIKLTEFQACTTYNVSFLLMCTLKAKSGTPSTWVPAVHTGDLDCILGSRLLLGSVIAIVGIEGMNQQMEDLSLAEKA